MPVEAVSMETATAFDRLRLALVGGEKVGKSRLAATARKPVLFNDADKRRESIAGMKGVYALTFTEPMGENKQPDAFSLMLTMTSMIESGYTLRQMAKAYNVKDADNWPEQRPATLVDDSLASISKAAMAYALYTQKDIRREITVGGRRIMFPGGWDAWNADISMVSGMIDRHLAIPGLDVIVIYHEQAEEAPDSTSEKPKMTGKIDFYPGRFRQLIKYFNEVWRITRVKQVPDIQYVADYRFTASSNLDFSKIKPEQYKPDIEYMINLALGTKSVPAVTTAPAAK